MPTELGIRKEQKALLFLLKKLEKDNEDIKVKGLREAIIAQETVMDQRDIPLVEKQIARLYS